ncbi:MAG: caspase family protein, partial [Calditrichaeota bacterium]|nr:caspase family protein [Calditrichota bacterium]
MIQPENPGKLPFSKSRAYIIGINAYQHISPLSTAVNDARMIATVLERRQGFEVSLLTDPGAADIRRLLQEMSETVTASDRA